MVIYNLNRYILVIIRLILNTSSAAKTFLSSRAGFLLQINFLDQTLKKALSRWESHEKIGSSGKRLAFSPAARSSSNLVFGLYGGLKEKRQSINTVGKICAERMQ